MPQTTRSYDVAAVTYDICNIVLEIRILLHRSVDTVSLPNWNVWLRVLATRLAHVLQCERDPAESWFLGTTIGFLGQCAFNDLE